MYFLAATFARHRLPLGDSLNQFKPLAVLWWLGEAVHAARSKCTNRIAHSQAVAVNELFDCCFVGPVMALGPSRMRFVERPIIEDLLVDRTSRNEYESTDAGIASRFDQA